MNKLIARTPDSNDIRNSTGIKLGGGVVIERVTR